MYYLLIDTCNWMDLGLLSEGLENVLARLEGLINDGEIQLVVSNVGLYEWKKKKDIVIKNNTSLLRDSFKVAREYGGLSDNDLLQKIADIKKIASALCNRIDILLANAIPVSYSDKDIKLMIELALKKKQPFKRGNNSVADALMLLSYFSYVEENDIKHAIFVSRNPKDFSDKPEPPDGEFHPDLQSLNKCAVLYYENIGSALNVVKDGTIDDTTIDKLDNQILVSNELLAAYQVQEILGSITGVSNLQLIVDKSGLQESLSKMVNTNDAQEALIKMMDTMSFVDQDESE
ncbi:MAG TPA: PIN domain-containing protein [Anaerolineae bacterium]|nr:PIN domain-containing protein [Anaerolineae bacterium]